MTLSDESLAIVVIVLASILLGVILLLQIQKEKKIAYQLKNELSEKNHKEESSIANLKTQQELNEKLAKQQQKIGAEIVELQHDLFRKITQG